MSGRVRGLIESCSRRMSHVVCCVVYPHCLVLVKPIIYNLNCVALIIGISAFDTMGQISQKLR